MQCEGRLQEVNVRVRAMESDDVSNSHRKEFSTLERRYQSLRKDAESLDQELEIASRDPKEAHAQFVARVNNFKQAAKDLADKATALREENAQTRRALDDMDSNHSEDDNGDAAKYELLVKRDQEMTAFMDKFDDTRSNVLSDQKTAKDMIVALLESISKGIEDSTSMPSVEAMSEMESSRTFKEKNMATAQRTMEGLKKEKAKREKELVILRDR